MCNGCTCHLNPPCSYCLNHDTNGQKVDEDGYLINDEEEFINGNGELVDEENKVMGDF